DERGHADAPPPGHGVLEVERSAERQRREHGVELPLERAVLTRARAEQGELARLALREAWVALAQATIGRLEIGETGVTRQRPVDASESRDGPGGLLVHVEWRRPGSPDHYTLRRPVGKGSGIGRHDLAAHRVADQYRPLETEG